MRESGNQEVDGEDGHAMSPREHLRIAAPIEHDESAMQPVADAASGSPREDVQDLALARARRGDAQAWARLYHDHYDGLHRHVTYMVGNPTVAEDLVQEVFARAVVSVASYDGRSSFATWLRGIASNVIRMHWRSQSRRQSAYDRLEQTLDSVEARAKAPDDVHLQSTRANALLAALDSLPANLREAFVALELQQRPAEEVASELGISPGNLRVRASRARTRVRDELQRLGWLGREEQP